jgi:acetylglutamate kinase
MRALIKLGGTLLETEDSRRRLALPLAALHAEAAGRLNRSIAIVHGGGKQMTAFLAERGVPTEFVGGLRVTTPDVVDALLKVFAGSVNHQLVAALVAAGAPAAGLSGIDAALAVAEQMDPRLGQVGRIVAADGALLRHLCCGGYLPVVACVAGGRNGDIFNVNADQMAVACAAAAGAETLLFLTDVDGVRTADGAVARHLTPADCRSLIQSGVATGGMQAKLEAACDALDRGVARVLIAPGIRFQGAVETAEGTAIHA